MSGVGGLAWAAIGRGSAAIGRASVVKGHRSE